MLTAEQIRAARAILRLEQSELAELARVHVETIKRLEGQTGPLRATEETILAVGAALRRAGDEFISATPEDGPGVRLAVDKTKILLEELINEVVDEVSAALHAALRVQAQKDPKFFERDVGQKAKLVTADANYIIRCVFKHIHDHGSRTTVPRIQNKNIGPGSPESPLYGGPSSEAVVKPAGKPGSRAGRASKHPAWLVSGQRLKPKG
jgi:transcriptional regulator with XRE-family HTH domain